MRPLSGPQNEAGEFRLSHHSPSTSPLNAVKGDPPALYADASKVRRELGWVPRYDYDDPDRLSLPYDSCAACIATAVRISTIRCSVIACIRACRADRRPD